MFGITASIVEYEHYIKLANERPQLSKNYLAYFGDIYLMNGRLLPEIDIATMFHASRSSAPTRRARNMGVDDLGVARILHSRMRPGDISRSAALSPSTKPTRSLKVLEAKAS